MRSRAVVLIALGACGFRAHSSPADALEPDAIDSGSGDAASEAASDVLAKPFCDSSDPDLVVCYEFENTTADGSSHHLDATMTNVTFVAGKQGKAMQFAANSAADVADSSAFDVSALTIEAWIQPTQLPSSGNRAGIVDMNGQYGFFVHSAGDLHCTLVNGPSISAASNLQANQWAHVACTYDGSASAIYVNGSVVATGSGGGTLATGGTTGISIAADNPPGSGSQLIGLIDEVRMMNVARTPGQICADAGKTMCP